MKVDKDRQMVVLEDEFQVRGWVDGQGGAGRPKGLAVRARKSWSTDVILGKRCMGFCFLIYEMEISVRSS